MLETTTRNSTTGDAVSATVQPRQADCEPSWLGDLVPPTFQPKRKQRVENKLGTHLALPRCNAAGIAGLRWDIEHGRLTVREVAMMTVGEVARRYKVCRSYALSMQRMVSKHGIHGAKRYLDGTPRILDQE